MGVMKVLVIGATGKQGSHVAHRLIDHGHKVRAFTRHPDSPVAKELERLGAEIATGNLEDRGSIERAARDVDAVFGVTTPYEAGPEAETREGLNIVDAAKATGKYLVYNSVASADQDTGIPHFDSKWTVEQHIKGAGVESAVIAPVYFMENIIMWGKEQLKQGMYATPLAPDTPLQQIAVSDVAEMSVMALEDKGAFLGKRIDIASDELTGREVAEIMSRVLGRPIKYVQIPDDATRKMGDDLYKMYEWFTRVGYSVDIPKLRREYPQVSWHKFEQWAREQDWEAILGAKTEAAGKR